MIMTAQICLAQTRQAWVNRVLDDRTSNPQVAYNGKTLRVGPTISSRFNDLLVYMARAENAGSGEGGPAVALSAYQQLDTFSKYTGANM